MPVPIQFQSGFRLVRGEDLNSDFAALGGLPTLGAGVNYFVNETIGHDANNGGQDPTKPLATIGKALTLEASALTQLGLSSVGRNSVVYFTGTIHLTSSISWNVPGTHLIGLCAPEKRGKRARLSVSGSTGFNKLVDVTKTNCYFANFGTFFGWTDSSTSLLAWSDTAGRNCYDNVEFLGFGDDTVTTGSANLTGSRAFYMSTTTGETTWRNCVFGMDTQVRNATNYTVEIAGGAPRLYFENCDFEARLGSSGTSASHVLIGSGGIDRYAKFVGCRFANFAANAMAQALNVNASPGGTVLLDQSTIMYNITAWQGTPGAQVQMNMTSPGAGGGKAITNA